MAEEIIKRLVDDIDRTTDDVQRIEFTWQGTAYEVDLSKHNRITIEEAIAPLIQHGRKARARRTPAARTSPQDAAQRKAVREWATANGIEVPARGRIPADVLRRYEERNDKSQEVTA